MVGPAEFLAAQEGPLYRFLRRFAANAEDARDAMQETFRLALENWDAVRQADARRAWLYRIGYRVALRLPRAPMAAPPEPPTPEPGPETALLLEERLRQLAVALASLPPDLRAVLVLREMQELSYEEIAIALEVPSGTIASRLSRARALLRAKLEGITCSTH